MSNEDTRKQFETWVSERRLMLDLEMEIWAKPTEYKCAVTSAAWHAWQAAVAAEREACKKKCDEIAQDRYARYTGVAPYGIQGPGWNELRMLAESDGADACSDAIRVRSEKGGGE